MKRGSAMLGTLITVAIICILLVVFMKGGCGNDLSSTRADGKGKTIVGQVKAAAQDDVCRSNLKQVREMISMAETDNDDKPPASLSEVKIPDSMLHCPIGHEAYTYDPATGTVKCPHPGHSKY